MSTKTVQVNRVVWLDLLRIVAIGAMMLIHVAAWHIYELPLGRKFAVCLVYDAIARFCVPVFFMISGAMWLDPGREVTPRYLAKHVLRVLFALLCWNVLYHIYDANVPDARGFTATGQYHLGFLYQLVGLYLIVPLLRKITANQKHLRYFVILSFVCSCIVPILHTIPWCERNFGAYLNASMPQSFVGIILYFVLGYSLGTVQITKAKRIIIYVIGILSVVVSCLGTWSITKSGGVFNEMFLSYLYPTTFFEALAIFVLFRQLFSRLEYHPEQKTHRAITVLSKCGFGMYLCHDFIIQFAIHAGISPAQFYLPISIPVFTLLLFVASFFISYIFSKLPILHFLVGSWKKAKN